MRLGPWLSSRLFRRVGFQHAQKRRQAIAQPGFPCLFCPIDMNLSPQMSSGARRASLTPLRLRNGWDPKITIDWLSQVISSIALDQ